MPGVGLATEGKETKRHLGVHRQEGRWVSKNAIQCDCCPLRIGKLSQKRQKWGGNSKCSVDSESTGSVWGSVLDARRLSKKRV